MVRLGLAFLKEETVKQRQNSVPETTFTRLLDVLCLLPLSFLVYLILILLMSINMLQIDKNCLPVGSIEKRHGLFVFK